MSILQSRFVNTSLTYKTGKTVVSILRHLFNESKGGSVGVAIIHIHALRTCLASEPFPKVRDRWLLWTDSRVLRGAS